MLYVSIILLIIIIILALQLNFVYRAMNKASKQLDEIEKDPKKNRQLKGIATNPSIEKLFQRINIIYQARQDERIVYQRRETQIRREIENISHDLRTPLTSIIGYVDLIKDEETKEGERQEYLNIIYDRAKVLQAFIGEFYEISRIEGEDYPLLLDKVPVQRMLQEAVVAYYHEFETRNIQVNIDLDRKKSFIIADQIQFNRILNNLIQNALKYATNQFTIKQFSHEGICIMQFINDRNNIREEELNHIFDRFFTGDASRTNGSSGLGLTITKLLVEKMQGQIDARLDEGMFVIELKWREVF